MIISLPAISSLNQNLHRFFTRVSVLVLFVLMCIPAVSIAQSAGDISIQQGAKLWIEGTAGPVKFKCPAESLSGNGEIENAARPQDTVEKQDRMHFSIALPVRSLDCGKRAMNKDMFEALKADTHPFIRYQLLEASLTDSLANAGPDGWMNVRALGIMEVAGVQDTTTIFLEGQILDTHHYRVKGKKQIHMDTYRIKPPTAMLGLIRADKELMVHFDVTVKLEE